MAAPKNQPTTQVFLDIHDIVNDLLIMKNGTTSLIIMVDAMNFGLLAEEEQDAIMYAYAGLLNSLNYPIQIVINSKTKDVTAYLRLLENQEQETASPVIQNRIKQYREFVSNLIQERNVLDKKFYVIIPASPIELGLMPPASILPGKNGTPIENVERSVIIEKATNLLEPKRDHLIGQFARIGLFSRQLTTQEIIQLFYVKYNPETADGQHIAESSSYSTPLVRAKIQGETMDNTQQPGTTADPVVPTPPTPQPPTAPVAPEVVTAPEPQIVPAMPEPASEPAPTPVAPTTQIESPEPVAPTESPAVPGVPTPPSAPVVPSPVASAAPVELPTAPAVPVTPDTDADIQADLNATVQQLNQSVPPVARDAESGATDSAMPPLPEI